MSAEPNRYSNSLVEIARRLRARAPSTVPEPEPGRLSLDPGLARTRASVALVVRPAGGDLELLLIERAAYEGDPWSGHMALPGGRRASTDVDSLQTAVREALEEVGLDIGTEGRLLGRLDDVKPRSGAPQIVVSPFVFGVEAGTTVRPNAEVAVAIWVPLSRLADPGATTEHLHALGDGAVLRFPAIGYQKHVIWGITLRILEQFLEIARLSPGQESVQ